MESSGIRIGNVTIHRILFPENKVSLRYTIDGYLNFDNLINLMEELSIVKFVVGNKKLGTQMLLDMKNLIQNFKKDKNLIEDYLKEIQQEKNIIEIKVEGPYKRFLIYMLCKIFNYDCEKITDKGTKIYSCKHFSSTGECGCDYVPRRLYKYRGDNSYDDSEAYYNVPYTYKIGVRIKK